MWRVISHCFCLTFFTMIIVLSHTFSIINSKQLQLSLDPLINICFCTEMKPFVYVVLRVNSLSCCTVNPNHPPSVSLSFHPFLFPLIVFVSLRLFLLDIIQHGSDKNLPAEHWYSHRARLQPFLSDVTPSHTHTLAHKKFSLYLEQYGVCVCRSWERQKRMEALTTKYFSWLGWRTKELELFGWQGNKHGDFDSPKGG